MTVAWIVVLAIGLFGPVYALFMGLVASRRAPLRPAAAPPGMYYVCLVPCLDEGLVVVETVKALLAVDERLRIVVIDDASTDGTAELVEAIGSARVVTTRRELPHARTGKGRALNHGFSIVADAAYREGIDPHNIVVGVFDADGTVDAEVIDHVGAWFADPTVGGVQIGVRISNRQQSFLARMQDVEFSGYAQVFQGGRNAIGSTGLGGNGQFARLSALLELGDAPWSDCLTEDLHLGLALGVNGWRSVFDPSVAVHQQGIHQVGRLVRQRTRWFQGHLQCSAMLRPIWRSRQPLATKLDLTVHLLMPIAMLLISVPIAAAFAALFRSLVLEPEATLALLTAGPIIPWWYLIGFMATPLVAAAYWRSEPEVGFVRGVAYSHTYSAYTWIWFIAGWKAVWRHAVGRSGWVKTARTVEPAPAERGVALLGPKPADDNKRDKSLLGHVA